MTSWAIDAPLPGVRLLVHVREAARPGEEASLRSCRRVTTMLIGLTALVCAGTLEAAQPDAGETGRTASRSIELICGGGFTGAAGGRRIDAAGRLWQVAQPLGAPRTEQAIGVDAEAAHRWNAWLDAAGFEHLGYRRPGNISCTLSRSGDQGSHRITWSGSGVPAALPAALIRVVTELRGWPPPAMSDGAATSNSDAASPLPAEAER